jgi:choloylglycine hydrolase
MTKIRLAIIIFALLMLFAGTNKLEACSVFKVTAEDATIISARTMEFGHDMGYAMIAVPRGKSFVSPASDNSTGLKWKTKLGYVGNNVLGDETVVTDGLNEAGLSFSQLWYDGDMQWQVVGPEEKTIALANIMLGSWVLGNFSTVSEAAKAIKHVRVFGRANPEIGGAVIPAHFILHDAKGGCMVVEYEKGELHIYDNPLGIMTNAPNFPWMLTNLRNYVGMKSSMAEAQDFSGLKTKPTGHGSGMFGLPGDITPPSRFVRMAVMTKFADKPRDAQEALNLSQHIAGSLHIVRGMAVDRDQQGHVTASETTQWSSFRDLTNRIYYFRTYDNCTLRKIDLKKLNFAADKVRTIKMFDDKEVIIDVTERAN